MRSIAAASLLVLVSFVSLTSAPSETAGPADTPLALADLAWERGDYPAALAGYLRLLDSPDAASVLEPIALRTGELYTTTELTRDGAAPQFSPDGRYILYESGPIASRVTRLVSTADPGRTIAELTGNGASFSPDSQRIVYWKAQPQSAADTSTPAARATLRDVASGRETTIDTGALGAGTLFAGANDTIVLAALPAPSGPGQLHVAGIDRVLTPVTTDATDKIALGLNSTG